MGKYTNEKSLMVVQDNFLNRIKNFFTKAFWSRKYRYEEIEEVEEEKNDNNDIDYIDASYKEYDYTKKERKLYNFDADNNDDWPGDGKVEVIEDVNGDIIENPSQYEDRSEINQVQNQEPTLEEQYDREIYTDTYIEKMELEQKLMNYYESIKKGL